MATNVHIKEQIKQGDDDAVVAGVQDILSRIAAIPANDVETLVIMVHVKEGRKLDLGSGENDVAVGAIGTPLDVITLVSETQEQLAEQYMDIIMEAMSK
jgi:hypothetical protein